MTINKNDVANLTQGHTPVLSPHGDWIGTVGRVYTSDDSGEPTWATVETGLFGTHETFIPLRDAEFSGHDLRIPYDKHTVKGAPRVAPEAHLTPDEEDELYHHYGLEGTHATSAAQGQAERHPDAPDAGREPGREADRSQDVATDSPEGENTTEGPEQVTGPGERTTRLRRFVVTERVVQDVEELPDEGKPADDR